MIAYFSGTGNSKWAAQKLGVLVEQEVVNITSVASDDFIKVRILVIPVYAWGVPRWVKQYLITAELPQKIDIVLTCGDDIGMTDVELRNFFSKRNSRMNSCHSLQMPNTYVALPGFDTDSQDVVSKKMETAHIRLQVIAERLKDSREVIDVVRGGFPRIKSYILRPLFNHCLTDDKRFKVDTKACIHCYRCADICPVQNVRMTDEGIPKWLHHCADCSACYHVCPKHAIQHSSFTKNKGQKKLI